VLPGRLVAVIPRIVHPRFKRTDKIAFGQGESARPLRIFVDGETVPDSPELEILQKFANHGAVEVIGTDARFANLLRVGTYDARGAFTSWDIEFSGGGRLHSGVGGASTPEIGRRHSQPGQEARAERAMVMAKGAADHGADAFVTTDPLILNEAWVNDANPMSGGEAVALLGLFLRTREDFAIDIGDKWRYNFDRALFYWVLLRANLILRHMMSRGQPCRDARELVAILRNTIHQEALRTITWQSGGTRSERVIVPAGIETDLEATVARVGTPAAFGLSRQRDGRLYIDPGVYIEAILPSVFAALNGVMEATPVESLPGVNPAELLTAPPDDETFNAKTRQRIRLLGGIG